MAVEVLQLKPGERTPAGGVKAVAVFLDDQGRNVPKDRATQFIIRELDAGGNLLCETFGRLPRPVL